MLRNDKGLSVMYYKRVKCIVRTADCDFFSFYQIQHIYTSACAMSDRNRKPVPSCFDEFIAVKSCSLFPPAIAFRNKADTVVQIFSDIFRISFPCND